MMTLGEFAMITFYKARECPSCEDIAEALDDLVMSHGVLTVEPDGENDQEGHVLVDNVETFRGHTEIWKHVEALRRFRLRWTRYQSDLCHVYSDEDELEEAH